MWLVGCSKKAQEAKTLDRSDVDTIIRHYTHTESYMYGYLLAR